LTRRSIIATAAALAAAAGRSKCAVADDDLPDAADALTRVMPQPAPRVTFATPGGRHLTLADYAGKILVFNLWATWCRPCVAEIPSFAQAAPQLAASGVLILPVSIDLNGAAAVRPFYAGHGISTLPILLDPNGNNLQALNTPGVPTTIVINGNGQMVAKLLGPANWNTARTRAYLGSLGQTEAVKFVPA
jgi:thiol-disulfide isomerase/thioredoxin